MLREDFLESYLQYKLEEAFIHTCTPGTQEEPFKNFYKAREIYLEVLKDEILKEKEVPATSSEDPREEEASPEAIEETKKARQDNIDIVSLKAHICYLLAKNYHETEEGGQARQYFKKFLQTFARLPFSRAINFMNLVQDVYNSMGLILINSGDDDKGMAYLLKAEKLYQKVFELLATEKPYSCYNTVDLYSHKLRMFNASEEEKQRNADKYKIYDPYTKGGERSIKPLFRFYYQGGLNIEKTEEFYTLTCFYLAQCWTKFGDKEKSAYYCGITMKRQLDSGQYEVIDY